MSGRKDPYHNRRCCGRAVSATWDDAGRGIWKCRRCDKTIGRREYADLAKRGLKKQQLGVGG